MRINKKILSLTYLMLFSQIGFTSQKFTITSPDIPTSKFSEQFVSNIFGCNGSNKSPTFSWQDAPKHAKSFVLMMYDPDAPTGSGWWHWVIANIPVHINQLTQGVGNQPDLLPNGAIAVRNDFGHNLYGGPCPIDGEHRYQFTLYALDIEHIEINDQTSAAYIGFIANMHSIATASVTYYYQK